MKLIINSNINYKKPLLKLISSLRENNFNFKQIVLVVSESENSEPKLTKVFDQEICVVEVEKNNFDYSAYSVLFRHQNHELIKSDSYFHLLDTTTVGAKFQENYIKYCELVSNTDIILTCPPPHSNICVFGNKLINKYSDNFEVNLTKDEAIRLEYGLPVGETQSITKFGTYIQLQPRKNCGEEDVYQTGHPRQKFHYAQLDVYKWILYHQNGDMTNNIRKNNPDLRELYEA